MSININHFNHKSYWRLNRSRQIYSPESNSNEQYIRYMQSSMHIAILLLIFHSGKKMICINNVGFFSLTATESRKSLPLGCQQSHGNHGKLSKQSTNVMGLFFLFWKIMGNSWDFHKLHSWKFYLVVIEYSVGSICSWIYQFDLVYLWGLVQSFISWSRKVLILIFLLA